jgi:hypothetical protein
MDCGVRYLLSDLHDKLSEESEQLLSSCRVDRL